MSLCRAILLGPLAARSILLRLLGLLLLLLTTLLTQLGGIYLWVGLGAMTHAGSAQERWLIRPALVAVVYLLSAIWLFPLLASVGGRVALPCWQGGASLQPHSRLYCLANRHYVVPKLAATLESLDQRLAQRLPDRPVRYLDAGFPFGGGRRIDLMFLYRDENGDPHDGNGSPVGYFAFVEPDPAMSPLCPDRSITLRWNLAWLQPLLPKPELDEPATRALIEEIARSKEIGKSCSNPICAIASAWATRRFASRAAMQPAMTIICILRAEGLGLRRTVHWPVPQWPAFSDPSALGPQPSALSPQPSALSPQSSVLETVLQQDLRHDRVCIGRSIVGRFWIIHSGRRQDRSGIDHRTAHRTDHRGCQYISQSAAYAEINRLVDRPDPLRARATGRPAGRAGPRRVCQRIGRLVREAGADDRSWAEVLDDQFVAQDRSVRRVFAMIGLAHTQIGGE